MGLFKKMAGFFGSKTSEFTPPKLGRNDSCWCGSGKKYKKCHLDEDQKNHARYCAPSCGST